MTVVVIILSTIICILFFVCFIFYRRVKSLESYVLFYEDLFDQISNITDYIIRETDKMLSKNLILNVPEIQTMITLVKNIKSVYTKLILHYNNTNKYRHFIEIESEENQSEQK